MALAHSIPFLVGVALAGGAAAEPAPRGGAAPATVASPAPEIPAGAVVPLETARDVAALCAALVPSERARFRGDAVARGDAEAAHDRARSAALARRYRVTVPGQALAFAPYDPDEEALALSPRAVLTGAGGAVRIWAADDDLSVAVPADRARRIVDAQRERRLALSIVFDLPGDDGGSPCAHAAGARQYVLAIDPVSWQYRAAGVVLARGGEGADRPLVSAAEGARPRVEVGVPVGEAAAPAVREAVTARGSAMAACYATALKRDPAIDGTLVIEVQLDAQGGKATSSRVAADSVQDEGLALAGCVRDAVAGAPFPRGRGGRVSIPIQFTLEPPRSAAR